MTRRGRFIVFEGLDGSGTSTQVYRLRDFLLSQNVTVEVGKEPTNGPIGAAIRLAIEGRVSVDPRTLALAFAADRADHLYNSYNGILPALEGGKWVISDRYALSSLAYQSVDIDELQWLMEINRFVIRPDLTVFIDTPVEVCGERILRRSSHFELFHSKDKLERVWRNFLKVVSFEQFVGTLVIADGSGDAETVFGSFLPVIEKLLAS